jgi:integrase
LRNRKRSEGECDMGKTNNKNLNAPGKGANVTVDPIRSLKDIQAITNTLKENPRNRLLFVMGINNGLRVTDLLKIRVREVRTAGAGDIIRITETKTGKQNVLVINALVHKALQDYFQKTVLLNDDFVFKSTRGSGAIKRGFVNKLIKRWTASANLKGRYGCASLRKTWGYIQRTVYGVGYEVIAKRFKHSSPAITMRYLGVQDQEVYDTLMHDIG